MQIPSSFMRRMARQEPRAGATGRTRAWPRVLVFLLLFAFVAQGTAVHSHIHPAAAAKPFASTARADRAQLSPKTGDSPAADCPLCQEAAMAGAYVLAAAPAVPPPPARMLWSAPAEPARFQLPPPSPGWRSRAPPE